MATDNAADAAGAPRSFDWWRATDDLWRWSARVSEAWADDLADDESRRATRLRRVASLVEQARAHSSFYGLHYRDVAPGATDLSALPPVDRPLLMANFDGWVTDPRVRRDELARFIADPAQIGDPYLGKYTIWTSSGTTGVPGVYVQDADAMAVYSALMTTRFRFEGTEAGSSALASGSARMAFVAALGGHFAGIVSWERQRRLYPAIASVTRAFSILEPLADLVARLNEWQPSFVSSYPTMLALLAVERREGRLTISPRALWCGGEGLSPGDRASIEAAFECPMVEDYGASECMNMAFGCGHGRLHVNDDWVVLEPVDENRDPVPPGQASATVLVTNLANRVQPLIRYDLSDSVTLDETRCLCGSRRPSVRIEGRSDDVLVLDRAGERSDAACLRVLPLAIESVIEEEAGVHRFQLIQTSRRAMRLRIDAADRSERTAAFRRLKKVLLRFLAQQGAAPVALSLDGDPPEVDAASGKLRQVRVLAEARAGSRGG